MLNGTNPLLKVFIAKTKTAYQIERQIATKLDKLLKHYEKFEIKFKSSLNHLIIMVKFYIYKCKLNGTNLSLKVFIAKTKTVYQIERQIRVATKHVKLLKHYEKWKKILPSSQ